MASYSVFCDPGTGGATCLQTLRSSSAYTAGNIYTTACHAAILGGLNNLNCQDYSTILHGYANCNEKSHSARDQFNTMSNGYRNHILDNTSCQRNNTLINGTWSSISGGYGNTISGGSNNTISGTNTIFSAIGGGGQNTVSETAAGIFTGFLNSVYGHAGVMAGGASNTIDVNSCFGAMVGGACNTIATSCFGVIGGGCNNSVGTTNFGVVVGGFGNSSTSGIYNSIMNGNTNSIYSVPPTGGSITAVGSNSILGGACNCICGIETGSAIVAGRLNTINSFGSICGQYASGQNGMLTAYCSLIAGDSATSSIVSAGNSIICNGFGTTVAAGDLNCINFPVVTVGGVAQVIYHSSIGGGAFNRLYSGCSVIGGGYCNRIENAAQASFLGGGCCNYISSNSAYSFLGGGQSNTVSTNISHGVVTGGRNNNVHSNCSTVSGGYQNIIFGQSSTISGGYQNVIGSVSAAGPIPADYSVISGGRSNVILPAAPAAYSSIGGGCKNFTCSSYTFIGGGNQNYAGEIGGVIGGGLLNCICTNSAYGVITGGARNCINTGSNYAGILSGCGNTVAHNWAAASGCQVATVAACAFHANQFVSQNTPPYSGTVTGLLQCIPTPAGLVALGVPAGSHLILI